MIGYRTVDFVEALRTDPVDVVLDLVGGDVARRSLGVTRRGGIVVQFVDRLDDAITKAANEAGVRVAAPGVHRDRAQLEQITELAVADAVVPVVSKTYRLDEVAKAHVEIEEGHVRGKLVLRVS